MQLINWPHTPKNHRGIQQRIKPRKSFEKAIAKNTYAKRAENDCQRNE
jgi:hypothetical protein